MSRELHLRLPEEIHTVLGLACLDVESHHAIFLHILGFECVYSAVEIGICQILSVLLFVGIVVAESDEQQFEDHVGCDLAVLLFLHRIVQDDGVQSILYLILLRIAFQQNIERCPTEFVSDRFDRMELA